MRNLLLYFVVQLLCIFPAFAQVNEVIRASNFGGVTNVSWNPAIADNRHRFDMNLVSLGFGFTNNYIGISNKPLLDRNLFQDARFQDIYLKEKLNGNSKTIIQNLQVQGPLSFMFSWGKNRSNKNAIAVTWNINQALNVSGVSEKLSRIFYWGIGYKADSISKFNFVQLKNQDLAVRLMVWNDYGFTYSRVVYDKEEHFVKVGGTIKILQGLSAAYVYAENATYRFENYDTLSLYDSDFQLGHDAYSEKFYGDDGGDEPMDIVRDMFTMKQAALSAAVDLGAVYEWRPKKYKNTYTMDCAEWLRRDRNNYLIQAGFSIMDVGAIKFNKASQSRNVNANIQGWFVGGEPIQDITTFDSVIANKPGEIRIVDNKSTFTLWLPTRFNLFVDANIYKGLGVNFSAQISPNFSKNRDQIVYPSNFTLTPRFDHKWVGVYIPVTVDALGNFGAGAGLRLGPLFVTSSNVITAFAQNWNRAVNVQAGLKLTIPHAGKQRDRDKDGVSNKKDLCKKDKGTCESKGCPDRDGDGVTDNIDKCPTVPGLKELQGCPDQDGDGITDTEDSCVAVPGIKELFGCPDRDGDGIADYQDECPDTPGLKIFAGCPDRDSDGVEDRKDACPDVPGDPAHRGCPDTDGDGLYDYEDRCIREAGPAENKGCPWKDTDMDGVLDKDDACPTVKGVVEEKGCPRLPKKELETVKTAFDNLEFETGKEVIRKSSYPSLNALASLLVSKPNYGLQIDGHTDNVGNDAYNQLLSEKRAKAVKDYLVKKGVAEEKIASAGYGETRPVATNDTPQGRQLNRRVEMKIIFR